MAQFHTHITPTQVSVTVDFPDPLDLDEDAGRLLEANLHKGVELALATICPGVEVGDSTGG